MTGAVVVQSRKEARALLPWSVAVLAATVLLAWATLPTFPSFRYDWQLYAIFAYSVGALAVAAVAFGHEQTHGTLSTLLVQPISRQRMLAVKIYVLTITLLALGVVAAWAFGDGLRFGPSRPARTLMIWAPVVAGVGLVPFLTIVTRRALGGVAFSIVIPGFLFALCSWFIPEALDANNKPMVSPRVWQVTWFGTVTLSAMGLLGLAWTFQRLQVTDGQAGRSTGVGDLGVERLGATTRRATAHWVRLTIAKELRLQAMTMTVSGLFVMLVLVFAAIRRFNPGYVGPTFDGLASVHAALVCFMAGALASAEERQLGTWSSQVLTPRSAARVWTIKSAVTVGLAVALSAGLPFLLRGLDPHGTYPFEGEIVALSVLAVVAAIYVSALSSSGFAALVATLPAIVMAMTLGGFVLSPIQRYGAHWLYEVAFADRRWRLASVAVPKLLEDLVLLLLIAAWSCIALAFAGANHRRADRNWRRVARQLLVLLFSAVVGTVLYHGARAVIWSAVR